MIFFSFKLPETENLSIEVKKLLAQNGGSKTMEHFRMKRVTRKTSPHTTHHTTPPSLNDSQDTEPGTDSNGTLESLVKRPNLITYGPASSVSTSKTPPVRPAFLMNKKTNPTIEIVQSAPKIMNVVKRELNSDDELDFFIESNRKK